MVYSRWWVYQVKLAVTKAEIYQVQNQIQRLV
jgi:hypothetical protein